MKASMELQLQLHVQNTAKDKFTFIPYGLDSGITKEAVKVHVLHERKRGRNGKGQNSNNALVQGRSCVFEWDSKDTPPQTAKGAKRDRRGRGVIGDSYVTAQTGAVSLLDLAHERQTFHFEAQQHFMWDEDILYNPVVAQMRDDLGFTSSRWIHSANFLIDHYLSRCGKSRFPHELLSYYWQDSASIKAFLVHAATLFSLETGLRPAIDAEELMCSALQEIRLRLSSPAQWHSDGTVLAIVILANAEEGREQLENASQHWRGLKQLLRHRGSFSSLRLHRDLHTMLLWREILTSNSYDFCFGHGLDDTPELQHCSEHLIAVFNIFAHQLEENCCYEQKSDEVQHFLGIIANRHIVRDCDWTSSMQRRAEIACLLYLSTLTVTAPSSVESKRMMERIRDEVIKRDRWGQVNQEELLFIILQKGDLEHEWRCQQLWQLSRCIYLTRTLNLTDWKTVRDMLSLYIGIKDRCDPKAEVLKAWSILSRRLLLEDGCHVKPGESHVTGWEGVPKRED